MKRIGLVIANQHFIPHGGIGQFVKGMNDMLTEQGHIVDVILDQEPTFRFFEPSGKLWFPDNPESLRNHRKTFSFKDSVRYETCANFRDSIMIALNHVLYDLVILQSPETLFGIGELGLHEKIPVVHYTHHENLIYQDLSTPTFTKTYLDMSRCLMKMSGIINGTQTKRNHEILTSNGVLSVVLPMPIPEPKLLEPYNGKKEGVLFIGRWEERKNPTAFIKAVKDLGLPVKVMTSKTHIQKAEADLKKAGIIDFDVRGSITGKEKVDFIRSASVSFIPSKRESGPFSLLESIAHCHIVVLEKHEWWKSFDPNTIHLAKNIKQASEMIKELYGKTIPSNQIEYINHYHNSAIESWTGLLDMKMPTRTSTKSGMYKLAKEGMFYDEYVESSGRFNSIEDVMTCYNSYDNLSINHSKSRTWIATKESRLEMPTEDISNLFDLT